MRQMPSSSPGLREGAVSLIYPHLPGTVTVSSPKTAAEQSNQSCIRFLPWCNK